MVDRGASMILPLVGCLIFVGVVGAALADVPMELPGPRELSEFLLANCLELSHNTRCVDIGCATNMAQKRRERVNP